MLALLMEQIYDIRLWDVFLWHDILTKFHEVLHMRSSSIKVMFQKFWEAAMLVLLMGGINDVRLRDSVVHSIYTAL
jgi:hypothetical protein